MKAFVVTKSGEMEIHEVSMPIINEKQALVRMIAGGMCGTDIKLIHKCFKGFPESNYPIILGHEGVGEVVEIGSKVTSYKIGDRVILPFLEIDEQRHSGYHAGYGALCEFAVVNDVAAFQSGTAPEVAIAQTVLSRDIDPVDAVMLVTFREVLSTIRTFGIKQEESIAVFGCGPVGLTYIKLMKLLGVKDIIAVDIVAEKLEVAKEFGAAITINGKEEDVEAIVRTAYPDGIDYVLDAVGLPSVINQGMPLIKDRGSILVYGVPAQETITIDFSRASYNFNVIYQQMPRKDEEAAAGDQIMQWVNSGDLIFKDFISDYFNFKDAVVAHERLLNHDIEKKGIIVF